MLLSGPDHQLRECVFYCLSAGAVRDRSYAKSWAAGERDLHNALPQEAPVIPFHLHRRLPLIRRPFYQRDQARLERDRVVQELDQLRAERAKLVETANFEMPPTPSARTGTPATVEDRNLVARIIASYRMANTMWAANAPGSMWNVEFFAKNRDVHEVLVAGDLEAAQRLLRDPSQTDLFYGFDNICRSVSTEDAEGWRGAGTASYQDLLLLSEAIGARRYWNPEGPIPLSAHMPEAESLVRLLDPDRPMSTGGRLPDVESLLHDLDRATGFRIAFPNPFFGEVGLITSRGVASYRAIQALYQAWRIRQLVGDNTRARIVEIGAGLGRTALYARELGLNDYTIVDLPLSGVAQGYFLGRTLGEDAVCLFGETRPGIHLLPPATFLDGDGQYDLVINVDSLTELAPETACRYCEAIKRQARMLLSINHERNLFTVRHMCRMQNLFAQARAPYWMRRGYVEEVFTS